MTAGILIKNGTIVDGSGKPRFQADLLVEKDRISAIKKDISRESAKMVIDASGKIVAPGFIDVHCHTDWSILEGPWDDHQERQGITTQIGGLCGTSPISLTEHFEEVGKRGLGTNYGLMIGHGSVRKEVLGEEKRAPTSEELERMRDLVKKAMDEGAFGLSTGLIYVPGRYSQTDEIVELARVVSKYGGIYATHMRSESDEILEALDEALQVAERAEVQLQISHIKVIVVRNWGLAGRIVEKVLLAKRKGLSIGADQYPYTVTGGGLYGSQRLLKGWKKGDDISIYEARYQDPLGRKEMAEHILDILKDRGGPEHFVIIKAGSDESLLGRNLVEAAEEKGLRPENLCLDGIMKSRGEFALVYAGVSEEEMVQFMREPWVMVGTDGVKGAFHPRTHGTFPRILGRYVRDKGVLRLEEAIRKMTSLPAETFGLAGRGRLLPSYYADLVIFDEREIIDNSTLVNPTIYPSGIEWVLVNGSPVVERGERTSSYPGVTLTR